MGLLRGRDLSEVAVMGVRVLEHADALARTEQQDLQMRLGLLAAGGDVRALFGEYFASDKEQEPVGAGAEAVDVSEDYDKVAWMVPSADQWAQTQAMLADTRIQVPTPDAGWI